MNVNQNIQDWQNQDNNSLTGYQRNPSELLIKKIDRKIDELNKELATLQAMKCAFSGLMNSGLTVEDIRKVIV